jgi:hypothetical protein
MLEREGGRAGFMLAAVALADKLARIVFTILRSAEVYDDARSWPEPGQKRFRCK